MAFAKEGATIVMGDINVSAAQQTVRPGLTKAMATDHGPQRVRVDIDTGPAEGYFQSQPDPAAARVAAGKLHALKRIGQPEEVGRVAVFLASEDASFVTGSSMVVWGGFGMGLPPQ